MTGGNPETWLAARLAAGKPAETWKTMAKIGRCAFTGYEVSDTGNAQSLDRLSRNGRPLEGGPVSSRLHVDGYLLADFRCDNPDCRRAHTLTMQKVVLWTFDKPRPRGMQASHLHEHPEWNWWPENLAWEDQPTNERRKTTRPVPPEPTHPCRNAPRCPNKVLNAGRNCQACVAANGRAAAAMLNNGKLLDEVAAQLGYSARWVYQIAIEHGGYEGTPEQAKGSRPPLTGWRARVARWVGAA